MQTTEDQMSEVRYDTDGPIVTLTLNRPEARNAIGASVQAALAVRLEQVRSRPEVRVVILTGAGTAFCAGGDLKGMEERSKADPGAVAEAGWHRQRALHELLGVLNDLEKVTIAAVNGPAMGLGCDLALCCDFVVAAPAARFSMSYIRRGLIPDGGGCNFLPRRVGLAMAKELIFSGRDVGAEEALKLGIADRLAGGETMLAEVREWARQFLGRSPIAIALAKIALNRTFERSLEATFDAGTSAQAICYTSEDHRRAVAAFLRGER